MDDRRHHTIIWLLSAAAGVALLTAVFFSPADGERWSAMRKRVASLRDQAQSRNPSRPVLRGKPVPGNAWDEYRLALNDVQTFREDEHVNLLRFIGRNPGASPASVEKLLAEPGNLPLVTTTSSWRFPASRQNKTDRVR